jgi:hypothetical protein
MSTLLSNEQKSSVDGVNFGRIPAIKDVEAVFENLVFIYEGTCSRQLDKRPVVPSYRAAGISAGKPNKEPVIHNGIYFASHMSGMWKAEILT